RHGRRKISAHHRQPPKVDEHLRLVHPIALLAINRECLALSGSGLGIVTLPLREACQIAEDERGALGFTRLRAAGSAASQARRASDSHGPRLDTLRRCRTVGRNGTPLRWR